MIGTDFEFFVLDPDQREGYLCIPAIPAFLGSGFAEQRMKAKWMDLPTDLGPAGYTSYVLPMEHGMMIEDGAAVEVPCDPGDTAEELVGYIREGIQATWEMADELAGSSLVAAPLVRLAQHHLDTRPELRILGCSPDIDLYGVFMGEPPQDPRETLWRTGGGHIHFSPKNVTRQMNTQALVMLCDLLLGCADVALEHTPLGRQRREMYGQPGKYRIQPWGVEYRTMSNVWTATPDVALSVLKLAEAIHTLMNEEQIDFILDLVHQFDIYDITDSILACDAEACVSTMNSVGEVVLHAAGHDVSSIRFIGEIASKGGVANTFGYSMHSWR